MYHLLCVYFLLHYTYKYIYFIEKIIYVLVFKIRFVINSFVNNYQYMNDICIYYFNY